MEQCQWRASNSGPAMRYFTPPHRQLPRIMCASLLTDRPEPGGAANAARIAVPGAHDRRIDAVGERMAFHQRRKLLVELRDIGEAAAEHDLLRVEHVDDAGKAGGEAIVM